MSDRVVRIGIIGAGFARTTQIPGFQNCEGAKIVAIASARREHAEEVARECEIENVESDWRGLVARKDIDLVSIVTPPVTHCEMTLAALDQGKAVLCEKPMAMNADEARRMTERAAAAGVLALIDHELRFLPGRIKMREMISSGEIGKIKHTALTFRSDSRADINRPWNWWSDRTQGGGALGAIASHVVDGWHWVLGATIREVACDLATHVPKRKDTRGTEREVTSDDEANLLVRFDGTNTTVGTTGHASISLVEYGEAEHRLEVFGSEGALRIEERGDLWQAQEGESRWRPLMTEETQLASGMRPSGWGHGFTSLAKKIIQALQNGETAISGAATFADGYQTQMVLDASRRANENRCWTDIE